MRNDKYWDVSKKSIIATSHHDRIAAARKEQLKKIKGIKMMNLDRQKSRYKQ